MKIVNKDCIDVYYDFVTKTQLDNLNRSISLNNNQILEQMDIKEIEKFLRKKKLEKLENEKE